MLTVLPISSAEFSDFFKFRPRISIVGKLSASVLLLAHCDAKPKPKIKRRGERKEGNGRRRSKFNGQNEQKTN